MAREGMDAGSLTHAIELGPGGFEEAIGLVPDAPIEEVREAYRRLRALLQAPPDGSSALTDLVRLVQERLSEARVASSRVEVAADNAKEPLRRRVLNALAHGPATTSVLAELVSARQESVSRVLTAMEEDGLVTSSVDPDDRRRRPYALTDLGVLRRTQHGAYGDRLEPPRLDGDVTSAFLTEAVNVAIDDRRRLNLLTDASNRLSTVVTLAEDAKLEQTALFARKELTTTLRQDRRWAEFDARLEELEMIASGKVVAPAEVVIPAFAHAMHERGHRGSSLPERAQLLVGAVNAYRRLHELSVDDPHRFGPDRWRVREAWSVAGLADNLRQQTELGKAIDQAQRAEHLFREEGEEYGVTWSMFTRGFCYRLRGQFQRALATLSDVKERAEGAGDRRTTANTLLQLGDVQRSLGARDEAVRLLNESIAQASELHLRVTVGFAESALGAALLHEGDLSASLLHLELASEHFSAIGHEVGAALNDRRLAAVHRRDGRLEVALEYATKAGQRYQALRSPAGVHGCVVLIGQIQSDRHYPTDGVCRALLKAMHHRRSRDLLELDPWFPQLLSELARATDNDALIGEADALVEDAAARLYEPEDEPVEIPGINLGPGRHEADVPAETNIFEGTPDEMAGESRLRAEVLLPSAA